MHMEQISKLKLMFFSLLFLVEYDFYRIPHWSNWSLNEKKNTFGLVLKYVYQLQSRRVTTVKQES